MKLIDTLIREYLDISTTLAYHIRKKNIVGIEMFERHQRFAAVKLIIALVDFQGITVEEVTAALEAEAGQDV